MQIDDFQLHEKIGQGNSCVVFRATHNYTGKEYAMKMMHSDIDHTHASQEACIMAKMRHCCIISLQSIFLNENEQACLLYELAGESLLELYSSAKLGLNENQIKCIIYQAALALQHIHKKGYIHRDIKPQNILIDRKVGLIKIIDFGSAKQIDESDTDYVCTRWYRAPQCLLGMKNNTPAMDIFALGCICLQLWIQRPVFPGDNSIDQLSRIFNLLGTPTYQNWQEGLKEIKKVGYHFPERVKIPLNNFITGVSKDFINLVDSMLSLDPKKRITAEQILVHPFFIGVQNLIPTAVKEAANVFIERLYEAPCHVVEIPYMSIGARRCRVKLTEDDIKYLQNMVNLSLTGHRSKSRSQKIEKPNEKTIGSRSKSRNRSIQKKSPIPRPRSRLKISEISNTEGRYQSRHKTYLQIHNEVSPKKTLKSHNGRSLSRVKPDQNYVRNKRYI